MPPQINLLNNVTVPQLQARVADLRVALNLGVSEPNAELNRKMVSSFIENIQAPMPDILSR